MTGVPVDAALKSVMKALGAKIRLIDGRTEDPPSSRHCGTLTRQAEGRVKLRTRLGADSAAEGASDDGDDALQVVFGEV